MPTAAAAAAPSQGAMVSSGQNPFWQASNLYAEKIESEVYTLGAATQPHYANVNPGNFLRGVRFLVRSANGAGGTATADNPANIFQSLDLENVDGGEILYPMGGYAYLQSQRYSRPWNADPMQAYDYTAGINPSISLFVQPEIRLTAGVLSNTDARSQYKYNYNVNTASAVGGTYTTDPTVTITAYMDAWGQPDPQDLEGVPNQPLPPGLALQVKRRHQVITLNNGGTDNIFQLNNTGNAIRMILAIVRDQNNARQDYLTDPIRWQQDNRNLGVFSPDMLFQWDEGQYASYNMAARPTGVYVFPRYFNPGDLTGQGWLYTSNATKLTFETASASGLGANTGTVEWITDEVYPVQNSVPPDLLEI